MKMRTIFLLAIAMISSSCMVAPSILPTDADGNPVGSANLDTDQAIALYLTGRPLDLVEGAWIHEGNAYEIVIVKNDFNIENDYDYLGIITRADAGSWKPGDVKLLMKATSDEDVFDGVWLMQDKTRRNIAFVVENKNLIQANFVSADGNTFFIRTYRKYAYN